MRIKRYYQKTRYTNYFFSLGTLSLTFLGIIFLSLFFLFSNFITFADGTNLLSNPSFETTSGFPSPWTFQSTGLTSASISQDNTTADDGTYSAKVDIATGSDASYEVQLKQAGIAVSTGRMYTVSFAAKASSARTIDVSIQLNSSPYTEYMNREVNITTSWQTYSLEVPIAVSQSDVFLAFNLAQNTGQVWIDTVSLADTGSTSTPSTETIDPKLYGTNTHFMYYSLTNAQNEIDKIHSAGLNSARFDVSWKNLETADDTYDNTYVTLLDNVLDYMKTKNIRPIITFLETPSWANGGCGNMCPPTNMQKYADAIGFLAQRYASTHPDIIWEIWNEPNSSTFWSSGPSGADYARMLRLSYTSIKAENTNYKVLGGSIVFNDPDFLKNMYAGGAKGYFDALAIHPYAFSDSTTAYTPDDTSNPQYSFKQAIEDLEQTMADYGDTNKPEYITEFGYSTDAVSDATRATYLAKAVDMVQNDYAYVHAFQVYVMTQVDRNDTD
ncbi:MAG TPA: carbohydrate binding domain-containing protein, partial [Legionellaceae bacterium]|nr:carbohydrate binding domain-containing protein [Legionellaceae bacterium]